MRRLLLFCFVLVSVSSGDFYRYLDLTPGMNILPRGPIPTGIAADMNCFQIEGGEDSLVVRGFNHGVPSPVFAISPEITVLRTDSTVLWLMDEFNYLLETDSSGKPVVLTRLGKDGQVLPGAEGAAYTSWEWENDSIVTVFSKDISGKPMPIKLQPSTTATAARLDDTGDLLYFVFGSVMAAGLQYELDANGRAIAKRAVDHRGETVVSSNGAAEARYGYDDAGNLQWTAWYTRSGELMSGEYSLPGKGNWEFNENGVVINGIETAYVLREFDENCLYISERNIGLDSLPVEDPEGRALTLFQREIHGGITESAWYDLDNNRILVAGVWATRRLYNDIGQVTETSTVNTAEETAEFPGGFAYTRFCYTDAGQTELIAYYDRNENPVVNSVRGCHARFFVYNSSGEPAEIRFLNTFYHLMNNAEGYARAIYLYDSQGNLSEEVIFDASGRRIGS